MAQYWYINDSYLLYTHTSTDFLVTYNVQCNVNSLLIVVIGHWLEMNDSKEKVEQGRNLTSPLPPVLIMVQHVMCPWTDWLLPTHLCTPVSFAPLVSTSRQLCRASQASYPSSPQWKSTLESLQHPGLLCQLSVIIKYTQFPRQVLQSSSTWDLCLSLRSQR